MTVPAATPTPADVAPDAPASEATEASAPETFDREYVEKLRRENAKFRTEHNKAAARLKALEDAEKTDAERQAEALKAAEARALEAEARAARRDIALAEGLTAGDAQYLDSLTDEEQMRALAARLKAGPVIATDQHNSPVTTTVQVGAYAPNEQTQPVALNGDGLERALRKAVGKL